MTGWNYVLHLANEAWFGLLVGIVLGVLGIVIGIVQTRRGRHFARLEYMLGEVEVIGPGLTEVADTLAITFAGFAVPRVTKASFGLWNSGTTTFRHDDVVAADPLRLMLSGDSKFLRSQVLAISRTVNQAKVKAENDSQAVIDFDYLDPGDGLLIEVLHTGSVGALSPGGTIRGLPQGLSLLNPVQAAWRKLAIATVFTGLSAALFVVLLIATVFGFGGLSPEEIAIAGLSAVFALLSMSTYALPASFIGKQFPKNVPTFLTKDPLLLSPPARAIGHKGG